MAKAYLKAIKACLAKGWLLSVYDGEEWAVIFSTRYKAVKEAIEAVEEATVMVRKADKTRLGSFYVILPGAVSDEESVADWSWTEENPVLNDLLEEVVFND